MKSKTVWGRIRYIAFLGLFISILATYWVFTNQTTLNPGDTNALVHPHRSYTPVFALFSVSLFCLYFYSGWRERRTSESPAR